MGFRTARIGFRCPIRRPRPEGHGVLCQRHEQRQDEPAERLCASNLQTPRRRARVPPPFFMRAGKKRCLGFGFYRDEAPGKPPYLVIKVGPAKKTHPYVAGKPVFSRACPLKRNPERRVDCFTRGKYVSSGDFSPNQRCPPDWERKPGEGC